MCVNTCIHINEPFSVKRVLDAAAKSFGSGQTSRMAQVDVGRNFLVKVNFLHVKRQFCFRINMVGIFLSLLRVIRTCSRSMENFGTVCRVLQNMFWQF